MNHELNSTQKKSFVGNSFKAIIHELTTIYLIHELISWLKSLNIYEIFFCVTSL